MNIFYHLQTKQLSNTLIKFSLIIMCSLTAFSAKADQNKIFVTHTTIKSYNFHNKFTAIGQVKSEHSKTYYAKVTGTIDSIPITQGKNIAAGDILMTIDANIAEAIKSKAKATLASAQATYKRDLQLLKKKIISSEISNGSKVALEAAKLDFINATNKYEDMVITAPYNGYIGVTRARVGDDVKIGDYLFSLIAHGDKTVFIELPETMRSKIDENSLIYALDSNNTKIQGRLIAVSDYLNDNGTITAKLAFPGDSNLVHGSYIEIEMIFSQHQALAIPEKILLKNNDGNFVYKITEDNKIQQVYITTGARTDNMIEIISGDLQAEDSLVLSGLTKVHDGAAIERINDHAEPTQPENDI